MAGKDGRNQKSIRFRLNLAKLEELAVFEYLEGLKKQRRCKGTLMRGAEMEFHDTNGDYESLAEMMPDFVEYIMATRTPKFVPAQRPVRAPMPPVDTKPEPMTMEEPDDLEEPDFDAFAL